MPQPPAVRPFCIPYESGGHTAAVAAGQGQANATTVGGCLTVCHVTKSLLGARQTRLQPWLLSYLLLDLDLNLAISTLVGASFRWPACAPREASSANEGNVPSLQWLCERSVAINLVEPRTALQLAEFAEAAGAAQLRLHCIGVQAWLSCILH